MTERLQTDRNQTTPDEESERLRRWRLVLGKSAESPQNRLDGDYMEMDVALEKIYGDNQKALKRGGLGPSAPRVARWLGDIRKYFPQSVVKVVQKDAFDRLGPRYLLSDPELLESLEVDVHLVATLISLSSVIPEETKSAARAVVRKLVDDVEKRIQAKTVSAVRGAISRATRSNRPRYGELDFDRTILLNLKNWDPDRKRLIVDRLAGFGHKRKSLFDVVLCVDQSGSMASSVVYSSIFAATLAGVPALSTRLVFFDSDVVDMSEKLADPVDVLFGAQLGGGTEIGNALSYCQSIITRPTKTILILISDLYDGGDPNFMFSVARNLMSSGVKTICLLALDDDGKPSYDEENASVFATLGAPTFACTPDFFPEMIASAINGRDVFSWASGAGFAPVGPASTLPDFNSSVGE